MYPTPTLLALLLALLLPATACATSQARGRVGAAVPAGELDWRALGLDELIARLPDVDRERSWDPEGERHVQHPAVTELRRRLERGTTLSGAQWVAALIGSGAIRWRGSWPEDEPFAISLRLPRWADSPRMRVAPRHAALREVSCGLRFAMCGLAFEHDRERAFHAELGSLPPGRHELVLDVVLEARGRSLTDEEPGILWQGELTLETEIVPELDAVLPPRSDPELAWALRSLVRIRRARDADDRARVFLARDRAALEALAGTALPLEVELLRDGRVVEAHPPRRRERGWWAATNPPELPPENHTLANLRAFPAPEDDLAGWTLRLRGVGEGALRWWGARSRLAGVLEIPLEEALRAGE